MKLIRILIILILFVLHQTGSFAQKKLSKVSESELKEWVGFLSSDGLKGRANGTPELEEAANYIVNEFKKIGVKTLPQYDSYFQEYNIKERTGSSYKERNVIGYIEGSDKKLKDEFIILSAHYDHIGIGKPVDGDSIYNGADDNASGVATILGIAKALKQGKGNGPKRSIVVIAFSGEELGLLGSRHFAQNPLVPLEKVVANFNFEMTGHSTKLGKRKFYITGDELSSISEFVQKNIAGSEWEQIPDPFKEMQLFYRSDNASLATVKKVDEVYYGIPAHTFCTWGSEPHYHQVNDESDAIDYENMASFVNEISKVTKELANSETWIEWEDGLFKRITLK